MDCDAINNSSTGLIKRVTNLESSSGMPISKTIPNSYLNGSTQVGSYFIGTNTTSYSFPSSVYLVNVKNLIGKTITILFTGQSYTQLNIKVFSEYLTFTSTSSPLLPELLTVVTSSSSTFTYKFVSTINSKTAYLATIGTNDPSSTSITSCTIK